VIVEQQARNRTNNRIITAFGATKCLAEWAEKYNLNNSTIGMRIKAGWPIEKAVSEPVKRSQKIYKE